MADGVADPGHRRKERINRDDTDGLIGFLVFVTRHKSAADLDLQFQLEFFLFIERADVLVGVHQFDILVQLDVRGGHRAFFVRREQQRLGITRVRLEQDLLQVQNDIGHVLHDAFNRGKLVHGAFHLDRGDGGAFQ
jgi:hypothetical protein